jgi:hypothetical protein
VIKKVSINVGAILGGYGVMVVFCHFCPPVNRTLQDAQCDLEPAGTGTVRGSCNLQHMLLTVEWKHALRLAMTFSNTCLKHSYV